MLFLCYPKCSTCQKAGKWLKEQGIEFEMRHIAEMNPSEEELSHWIKASGLPVKKFFNTSGLKYKELKMKDRLPQMSEEEQIGLLAGDGMLVKRPILVIHADECDDMASKEKVLVGFRQAEWEEALCRKED